MSCQICGSEVTLISEISHLSKEALTRNITEAVFIHIRAQNAGLLLRRTPDDRVIVDGFEASAQNKSIMQTSGRLVRAFPGRSVVFSRQLQGRRFTTDLADWIHKLSQEQVPMDMPKTRKAGNSLTEERDTAHPGLVTEGLMSILAAFGDNHDTPRIKKNVRDEVNWNDTMLPWRRSPFWLVLRVSMQLLLDSMLPADEARRQYKNFVAFVIAKICRMGMQHEVSHDVQMIINIKAARRLSKLGHRCLAFVENAIYRAVNESRAVLEKSWSEVQKSDKRFIERFPTRATSADTVLPLSSSSGYLRKVLREDLYQPKKETFSPSPGIALEFDMDGLPRPSSKIYLLVDLENWILYSLDSWRKARSPSDGDCSALRTLMRRYVELAKPRYEANARAHSIMLLVVLEMFRVLDIICLIRYPLLAEYLPEIPLHLTEPLLLPQLYQMEKLRRIERHIQDRLVRAGPRNLHILEDPRATSFCIKYYNQSQEHQHLKAQIERKASENRESKKRELEEKSAFYELLMEEARQASHEWRKNRRGFDIHLSSCHKCHLESSASSMIILVDEWPLPRDEIKAKATVFELRVPEGFAAWRDAIWLILHDLGRRRPETGTQVHQALLSYGKLEPYLTLHGQRLSLASITKSVSQSHYGKKRFPTTVEEVCVNNGLSYLLFDTNSLDSSPIWIKDQEQIPSFAEHCKTPLPDGPYANLQDFVDMTTQTPNCCIARQEECSSGISQHEYLAFASLRAGERLQWMSILRELASNDLSFNAEAVYCLIQQAALQAGTPNPETALRDSHIIFQDASFCTRLLELLNGRLDEVKANWKEQTRVANLALLGVRLLSLTPHPQLADSTRVFLRRIRIVACGWCRELVSKLPDCTSDKSSGKVKIEILRSAIICRMTYDVDQEHTSSILQDEEDVAYLVETAVYRNNFAPVRLEDVSDGLRRSLLVDDRVSRNVENCLRDLILSSDGGMNRAVSQVSGIADFTGNWNCVHDGPERQWLSNVTKPKPGQSSQTLHYNILTGELLVDGRPLGRLPKEYTEKSIYRTVFGPRILSVTTSGVPLMQYKSVKPIDGYQVHLGLVEDELVIKAISENRCLRVIPPEIWGSDLPNQLKEDFVHWMDTKNSSIEFRPYKEPWGNPKKKSVLKFSADGRSAMNLGNSRLIGASSHVGKAITSAIGTIETMHNIIIAVRDDDTIEAELPRLGIKFAINENGLLESRELAAVVEPRQEIGCLLGLQNKLILRKATPCPDISEKSILVPYGKVLITAHKNHRLVNVGNADEKRVRFLHLRCDEKLAKLRGPPEMTATLYRAYLHAVTSSVLPDPFTRRTGVQEALEILEGQSLRSSCLPSDDALHLLIQISSLTPQRSFYPSHLKAMQCVEWNNNLCQFIQNEEFYKLAKDIVSHANRFARLSGNSSEMRFKDRESPELVERAALRGKAMLNLHLGSQKLSGDSVYDSRDKDANSDRALRVHEIASLIRRWPSKMDVVRDLPSRVRQWSEIKGYHDGRSLLSRSCTATAELPLGENWGALYDLCRSLQKDVDSYKLMFLFGNIAYEQSSSTEILHTLLGVAFSGHFKKLVPEHASYDLGFGNSPREWDIRDLARRSCDPFEPNRWSGMYVSEKQAKYEVELRVQLDTVVEKTIGQWPCDRPSLPGGLDLLNIHEHSDHFASLFAGWNKNRKFLEHIREVQDRLNLINGPVSNVQRPSIVTEAEIQAVTEEIRTSPNLMELLCDRAAPEISSTPSGIKVDTSGVPTQLIPANGELCQIVDSMCSGPRKEYGQDIASSLRAMQQEKATVLPTSISVDESKLQHHHHNLSKSLDQIVDILSKTLHPKSRTSEVLERAGLWPRVTGPSLLSRLSTKKFQQLSSGWKQALTYLGETISLLQRSERLLIAFARQDVVAFYKEFEEPGRQGWSAIQYPDWLLIEIEGNFTIRHVQALVAQKMMSPDSGKNSVLQLNMGEGKSSVIIPMITAALANGNQIARLIVLKPLLNQTQTLLGQRLGELVDRRIYHVPFSRQTRLGSSGIEELIELYKECMREGGIFVTLPEHILSFRLMCREIFHKADEEAKSMMATECWLQEHCRDILDESDEILSTLFQLVYTAGFQEMLDAQPGRWLITQSILGIFAEQAQKLGLEDKQLLEVDYRGRSYPFITFLDPDAGGKKLLDLMVEKIGLGSLIGISFDHCSEGTRKLALKFIRDRHISHVEFRRIEAEFRGGPFWNKLHLLRGLIAFNILLFVFQQKRWMVNYGLALDRCLMAVPYRAKGVPSLRAEFGHPDVAITATCLSYYYGGLTSEQLRQSFDLLVRESDPPGEYVRWVADCPNLDRRLRTLNGVNLDDDELWASTLYPQLKFSKAAADFFMSKVVFPHDGKTFPQKLSASAWDLPSHNPQQITTGFSGTNDNKFLLPLSIRQHDLPQLHGTNAKVLNLLLKAENRMYMEAKDNAGKRLSVQDHLKLIAGQNPPIRVLIDVGAQVLESRNQDVVEEWLRLCPSAEGAVFFNDVDEAMVVDREGCVEKLKSSAFNNHLENCLVYLDEVHTRGIDLALPSYARAAVTLGPRLTKDRLVQGMLIDILNVGSPC